MRNQNKSVAVEGCALLPFGLRVDIYFPNYSGETIGSGESAVAGETVLGTMP